MAVIDKDDSLLIARSGRWGSGPCLPHHPVTVESDRCSLGRPVCKQACFPGKGLARRRCYLGHPPWRSSHSPGNRAGPMIPKKSSQPSSPSPHPPQALSPCSQQTPASWALPPSGFPVARTPLVWADPWGLSRNVTSSKPSQTSGQGPPCRHPCGPAPRPVCFHHI